MSPLTPARIAIGRKLFFDKHLSRDERSRAQPVFSDGRKVAHGINGQEGTRNAPATINRGYGRTFFWGGRAIAVAAGTGADSESQGTRHDRRARREPRASQNRRRDGRAGKLRDHRARW